MATATIESPLLSFLASPNMETLRERRRTATGQVGDPAEVRQIQSQLHSLKREQWECTRAQVGRSPETRSKLSLEYGSQHLSVTEIASLLGPQFIERQEQLATLLYALSAIIRWKGRVPINPDFQETVADHSVDMSMMGLELQRAVPKLFSSQTMWQKFYAKNFLHDFGEVIRGDVVKQQFQYTKEGMDLVKARKDELEAYAIIFFLNELCQQEPHNIELYMMVVEIFLSLLAHTDEHISSNEENLSIILVHLLDKLQGDIMAMKKFDLLIVNGKRRTGIDVVEKQSHVRGILGGLAVRMQRLDKILPVIGPNHEAGRAIGSLIDRYISLCKQGGYERDVREIWSPIEAHLKIYQIPKKTAV